MTDREFEDFVIAKVKVMQFYLKHFSNKKVVRLDIPQFRDDFDRNAKNSRVFRYSFANVEKTVRQSADFLHFYKKLLSASEYKYRLAEIVCTEMITKQISQAHDEIVEGIRFTDSNAKYYNRLVQIFNKSASNETLKDTKHIKEMSL